MKGDLRPLLLVEDNEDDAFLTKRALEAAGISHSIDLCRDGQEAIDYLQNILSSAGIGEKLNVPQFLLIDLKLPRVTGLEVLSWVRQHQVFSSLLVLILTSSSEQRDVAMAYRLHVNAYLVKPASQTEMIELARMIRNFWLDQTHLVSPSFVASPLPA